MTDVIYEARMKSLDLGDNSSIQTDNHLVNQILNDVRRPTILADTDGVTAFKNLAEVGDLNSAFAEGFDPLKGASDEDLDPAQQAWLDAWYSRPESVWEIAPDYRGIKALEHLVAAGYDVIVSSNRPDHLAGESTDWYKYWAPDLSKNVKFVFEGKGTKQNLVSNYGPKDPLVWFEDEPTFIPYVGPGISMWLPKRPWNKGSDAAGRDDVQRFGKWRKPLAALGVA